MRADVTPGAAFPDYELPDHTGKPRRLSEIQVGDPMIIVLASEAYSAKDQWQYAGLAVSPSPDRVAANREEHDAFPEGGAIPCKDQT